VDRLTYAVLTLGALGISYALQKDGVPNYQWGYYLGGFFGALLGINMIRRK
jgi:hypothetical protein